MSPMALVFCLRRPHTYIHYTTATRPGFPCGSPVAWFLRFWTMWSVTESSDVLTRFAAR